MDEEEGLVRRIYCAVALTLLAVMAHAQGTGAVREIVVNGNQRVSKEASLAVMQT